MMNETLTTSLPFFNDTSVQPQLDNTTDGYYYGLNSETYTSILYGIVVFSSLTVAANLAILTATKFTTAGKSATLVFIRSLCVGDMLVGLFGILKAIMLNSLDGRIINCFLPESVFLSSSTTVCLTLLWVNIDAYLRLARPFPYASKMDKTNVIMAMMVLWNGSFILGFLPLMGWSYDKFVCNFFLFYKPVYVTIIAGLWLVTTFASCVMQIRLRNVLTRIGENSSFIPSTSMEFRKYSHLVMILRINLILWLVSYLPCLLYVIMNLGVSDRENLDRINSNLFFFLPIFLMRSFLCAVLHSYKTVRIQKLLQGMTNNVTSCTRNSQISAEDSSRVISSICDRSPCRTCSCYCEGRSNRTLRQGKRVLSAAPSVITVITEENSTVQENTATHISNSTEQKNTATSLSENTTPF